MRILATAFLIQGSKQNYAFILKKGAIKTCVGLTNESRLLRKGEGIPLTPSSLSSIISC